MKLVALNDSIAMYALYLATGNTIYSQIVRAATIEQYLIAAETLIEKFDPISYRKARFDATGGMYKGVSKVLTELRRLESIPERREGYTLAMHRRLFEKSRYLGLDTLLKVIYDWFTVGLQGGLRRSEYCQKDGAGLLHNIDLCDFGTPRAFIREDILFYGEGRILLSTKQALEHPSLILCCKVFFRWQKNLHHGIHRWFYINKKKTHLCGVLAWVRIIQRYDRLMKGKGSNTPLAVYQRSDGTVRYLTSNAATHEMRELAKDVHGLTKKKDINRFSCHSLRVGACCIYFAAGYSPEFIKRILRWESDAWRKYVRDLLCSAIKANHAINDVDAMPLF